MAEEVSSSVQQKEVEILQEKVTKRFQEIRQVLHLQEKGHYAKQCPNKKKEIIFLDTQHRQKILMTPTLNQFFPLMMNQPMMQFQQWVSNKKKTLRMNQALKKKKMHMINSCYSTSTHFMLTKSKEELAYISQPSPNAKIYIFPNKYDKLIQVIAYLDTGAASSIIKPDILSASHWNSYSVAFKAANGQIFHISLVSKPTYIQLF